MTTSAAELPGLRVSGVSHRYDSLVALAEIELEVGRGEVHCLLGPSGSGKSTLLRLIAGLEELQNGEIETAGVCVARAGSPRTWVPPEKRRIGFVFQDYALFPHLNVLTNVTFGMGRGSRSEQEERARVLLSEVDMESFSQAMPHTLSGGQQQRVALARAMARNPAVMLLDEPFSGLDTRLRAEVRQRTLEVLRAAGVTTVIVTHDPQEALQLGDQISVLETGRLLQTGTGEELAKDPVSAEVADLFVPTFLFVPTL